MALSFLADMPWAFSPSIPPFFVSAYRAPDKCGMPFAARELGFLANLKNHLSTGAQLVKTAIANKKDALKQQVAAVILDKGGFTDMTGGSPLFEKEKYFKPPLPGALEAAQHHSAGRFSCP